jgi:hypothetical protein
MEANRASLQLCGARLVVFVTGVDGVGRPVKLGECPPVHG